VIGELVHRVQDTPVHRLESVAHVGQRAPDDDAHCVVEIRPPHLLFERDGQGFLGELIHRVGGGRLAAGQRDKAGESRKKPVGATGFPEAESYQRAGSGAVEPRS
jgi:hypothetical protein